MNGIEGISLLTAYQKIGTEVAGLTTEQALIKSGLAGWNQRLITPVVIDMENGTEYPGRTLINVGDLPTGPTQLGPVTAAYKPIQNEEAFSPLVEGLGGIGLKPLTMGAYEDGRKAFALFQVPEGHRSIGGDPIETFMLATKGNDGAGGIKLFPTGTRIACANQITGLITGRSRSKAVITVHHTRLADPFAMQQAEVLLGITSEWDRELAAEVERLQKIKVTKTAFTKTHLPAILGDRPETHNQHWDRKFDAIVSLWDSPVAAEGNTAWRAYNTITEFEQHGLAALDPEAAAADATNVVRARHAIDPAYNELTLAAMRVFA